MIGKFITLEGIDGAGKSTHIDHIVAILKDSGVPVVVTREPGGTPLGEKLRDLLLDKSLEINPYTETLLMFAARKEHLEKVILPALRGGNWVLCDRFTDSTYAYQGGGRGVEISFIAALEKIATDNIQPDLTLYFDIAFHTAMARIEKSRESDRFESESDAFFERVEHEFVKRSIMFRGDRVRVIDATQSMQHVKEQLQHHIVRFIKRSGEKPA